MGDGFSGGEEEPFKLLFERYVWFQSLKSINCSAEVACVSEMVIHQWL